MGCTSSNQPAASKQNLTSAPVTISDDGQQLINDSFRKWLKTNRPQADEYVLSDVLSTAPPANELEDYRTIVGKALDLLAERHDIKSTNKLGKLVQKEVTLASPKKVQHTIDVLKQTADKLRTGNIQLEAEQPQQTTLEQIAEETSAVEKKTASVPAGEPGSALKEALERARILFYKGRQAAIFANPRGGYDVRVLDDDDESITHDSNLLRSIILTEVKLRPKTRTTPSFNAPPPPTSSPPLKVLDENEITDDFRRSIDAALKGLEAVYQTKTVPQTSESTHQIPVEKRITRPASPPPLLLQYGVTNAPLPKSVSKERTNLSTDAPAPPVDHTVHLAEIIRQMAEQQKVASERATQDASEETAVNLSKVEEEEKNDLIMDAVEATTVSEIGYLIPAIPTETSEQIVTVQSQGQIERIVQEIREHGEKHESKESLPAMTTTTKQPSSYSLGLTSPLQGESLMTTSLTATTSPSQSKGKLRSENRPKSFIATEESSSKDAFRFIKQMSLDELAHLTQTGLSNPNLTTSVTKLGISTSSGKIDEEQMPTTTSDQALTKMATSISQIIEEHQPILEEEAPVSTTSPAPVVTPVDTQTKVKSPSHNVTYTEIIHSESRDGEQSRHFITESYDEHPSNEDEQTTTLKVITKSEFSNHPTSGEKIMEQSVQVITVKVRNETIKTTIQQATLAPTTASDAAYERRPVSELVKNFEVAAGNANT